MGGTSFTALHDPIFLRALVLQSGDTSLALLSLDLIEIGNMEQFRSRMSAELGIDYVIITATHRHNAPRLGRVSPGALAHDGGPEVDAYSSFVYDTMIAALREARASAGPARLGLATGTADVNVNRDEAQGLIVGAEVVRVAGHVRFAADPRLSAAERVVSLPVKKGVHVMDDMRQADVPSVDLRLALFLLGDIALAGVSGDVVTPIYWRLKRQSPLAATILISIANDRIGYLADDVAYDRATFEVNGSPVQPGHAESAIADGLTDMIESAARYAASRCPSEVDPRPHV
jgi:hypothetical protein